MRDRLVILLFAALAWTAPAAAEEGCAQFATSTGRKVDLFSDGYVPLVDSAQALPKDGVFALRLKPVADVAYPVAPERGRDSGYGGFVTLESIPAGRYRIVLSEDGWVDAVEEHARLPVLEISRVGNCPGIRQTVQFQVTGQPLTIQIGGVGVAQLNIAVLRIWNFEEWQPSPPRRP